MDIENSHFYYVAISAMYSCPLYIFMKLHTNIKRYEMTCRSHEPCCFLELLPFEHFVNFTFHYTIFLRKVVFVK